MRFNYNCIKTYYSIIVTILLILTIFYNKSNAIRLTNKDSDRNMAKMHKGISIIVNDLGAYITAVEMIWDPMFKSISVDGFGDVVVTNRRSMDLLKNVNCMHAFNDHTLGQINIPIDILIHDNNVYCNNIEGINKLIKSKQFDDTHELYQFIQNGLPSLISTLYPEQLNVIIDKNDMQLLINSSIVESDLFNNYCNIKLDRLTPLEISNNHILPVILIGDRSIVIISIELGRSNLTIEKVTISKDCVLPILY